jgi:glycosyltransferase involved in cell wall biosynthesis
MLHKLVSGTDPARVRNVVVSLRDRGTLADAIEATGTRVHTVGLTPSRPSPAALWRLRALLGRTDPGVIHGWMYHGNLAATLAADVLGASAAPVAWNVRATIDDFTATKAATKAVIRLGARLSRRAARIVYNSREGARQHAAIGYASDRAAVIPNGFDLDRFAPSAPARARLRAELGVAPDAVLLGQVARWDPMKDHEGLLRALAALGPRHADVHLVLAGRGVDRDNPVLAERASTLGLAGRVHALGERRDVPALFAAFDVAVSPSACLEGFPNAVGEAMACGTPCVVTDVGDSAWLVADTGRVAPPRDVPALAAALDAMLALRPEARARLGADARARVAEHFSLARVVAQYHDLYASLAACRT